MNHPKRVVQLVSKYQKFYTTPDLSKPEQFNVARKQNLAEGAMGSALFLVLFGFGYQYSQGVGDYIADVLQKRNEINLKEEHNYAYIGIRAIFTTYAIRLLCLPVGPLIAKTAIRLVRK